MPGLQPLTTLEGQLEVVGDRRTEIKKLNLGPVNRISVSGSTIVITHSLHFLANSGRGTQNVDIILGGEQGDLLVLGGRNVLLRTAGNLQLSGNFRLQAGRTIMLLFGGEEWIELSRKT